METNIVDYQEVERYAVQLQRSADRIAEIFNTIRRETRDVSNHCWKDKQQAALEELLKENAHAIYSLCQNMFDEGKRVKILCKESMETDRQFMNRIKN